MLRAGAEFVLGINKMKKISISIIATFWSILCCDTLAQDIPAELLDCATIDDNQRRLACFDREITRHLVVSRAEMVKADAAGSAATVVAPAPTTAPPAANLESATSGDAGAIAGSAEELDPPDSTGQSATVVPDSATVDAGLDGKAAEIASETIDPDEFTATVTKVANQPHGEHIVYLQNGQVWEEDFKSSYFPVEPGDEVTIKKRRFGGYRLIDDGGKGFRVKRIR